MSAKQHPHFRNPAFVRRLVEREPEAVTEVVEAYCDHLYKAAFGLGLSEEAVQDICHNTWATFFEILPKFQGRSHIRTFLFGIFYNKTLEAKRGERKLNQADPFDEVLQAKFIEDGHWRDHQGDPEKYTQRSEVLKIIEKCLEHLPIQQKLAFSLKVVQELDTKEICNELDISNTNLRQLLFRGKNKIKDCVDRALER